MEAISILFELYFRIHIHTAKRIHYRLQRSKIHSCIITNVNSIQIFQRRHRSIHSIDTRMCQLIPCITRYIWDRNIIISRCRCKQDLLRIRIHRHNNIHITSAVRRNRASHINTADKHIERFRHICFLLAFYLRLNSVLIQNLDLLREPLNRLIDHTHIPLIEHRRIHISIQKCICLIRQ